MSDNREKIISFLRKKVNEGYFVTIPLKPSKSIAKINQINDDIGSNQPNCYENALVYIDKMISKLRYSVDSDSRQEWIRGIIKDEYQENFLNWLSNQ